MSPEPKDAPQDSSRKNPQDDPKNGAKDGPNGDPKDAPGDNAASAGKASAGASSGTSTGTAADRARVSLFGDRFSEKEQKQLFLNLIIGIVLAEMAVSVAALVYSIANAEMGADGIPRFAFPWLGFTVAAVLTPALIMLLVHVVHLGLSRPSPNQAVDAALPDKARTFFALVQGAPAIVLLTALILIGSGIYYLDGLMAFLLKVGDAFESIAIWVVGGFTLAWIVSYIARLVMAYKKQQMEAEYAFRHEVLERTGLVILDTKHAPTTEMRVLPPAPDGALPPGALPPANPPASDSPASDTPSTTDGAIDTSARPAE